jgi:hypothetical protein
MSGKFNLLDAWGTGNKARVGDDGAVCVADTRFPPKDVKTEVRPFRQYMTDDGLANGTFDMQVTGTTAAPVDYYIPASDDCDRYITSISFVIADANATLDKFGNITALSNGCQLFYEDQILGDVDLHDSLKSNFDFVRLCGGNPPFGDAAAAFRASNVQGTSEGYIPFLDIQEIFEIPWGIRLPKESERKLVLRVKDDTTGVDAFNAIAYGFDRLIE